MSQSAHILQSLENKNVDHLIQLCQKLELDSHLSKVIHPQSPVSPLISVTLLASYLITHQIHHARFLTKRIPTESRSEMFALYTAVTERIWFHDWEGAFQLLNSGTVPGNADSNPVAMQEDPTSQDLDTTQRIHLLLKEALISSLRERVLTLVHKAYESIPLTKLSSLLGYSSTSETIEYISHLPQALAPKPWVVSPDSQYVYPSPLQTVPLSRERPGMDFLSKLANYTMELEMK